MNIRMILLSTSASIVLGLAAACQCGTLTVTGTPSDTLLGTPPGPTVQPAFDFVVREGETVQPLCGVARPESTPWQQVWRSGLFDTSGVNALLRDGDWLWIATPQDVVRLNLETLECIRFTSVDGGDEMLTGVRALLPDSEGRVWAAGHSALYCFDGENWQQPVQLDREDFQGLAFDVEGSLWTYNPVYRGKDEMRRYVGPEPSPGEVWIGETTERLFHSDCNNWFAYDTFGYTSDSFDFRSPEECRLLAGWYDRLRTELDPPGATVSGYHYPLMAAESDERLWMLPSHRFLMDYPYTPLLSFDGQSWQVLSWPYSYHPHTPHILSADDAGGGVWVGTREGLVFSDGQSFRRYPLSPAGVIPMISRFLHLVVGADGRLWVATRDDGLLFYDEVSSTWQSTEGIAPSLISADDRGGLWAVLAEYKSHDRSLSYFDGEAWTHHPYSPDWPRHPRDMLADMEGGVWLSFAEHALGRFDGETWEEYSTGTQSERLARGPQGEVYAMGEDRVLKQFDGTTWQPVLPPPRYEHFTISHELVRDIVVGPQGDVWVLLDAAPSLFVYRGSGWEEVPVPTEGTISALLVDSQGNLWADHSFGLLRYDGQSWETIASEKGSYALAEDGAERIWVARSDGLYVYDPAGE